LEGKIMANIDPVNSPIASTPTDADIMLINQSAHWYTIPWSAIKSSLKTYFDGLYNPTTAAGDIIYCNSTSTPGGLTKLSKGIDTQVLTLTAGVPSWADATGGGSVDLAQLHANALSF
jgi:hypothetical protein